MSLMRLEGTPGSIWTLARSGFAGIFRNVLFWVAFGYSLLVTGIAVTMVFVITSGLRQDPEIYEEAVRFLLTPGFLQGVIGFQTLAAVMVVALVGTRTVSRDRMLGGLEFLLSKPIPPWGYIASRNLSPVLAALLVLFVPVVILVLLISMLITPFPSDRVSILWGAMGSALVISLVLGILASGVGSLVGSPRKAMAIWIVIVVATIPLSGFAELMDADWQWAVGPLQILYTTTFTLMGTNFPGGHVIQGWAMTVVLVIASWGIMRWQVREVVR